MRTSTGLLSRSFDVLTPRTAGAPSLRVLSWNVLADGLSQHGDFVKARVALRFSRARRGARPRTLLTVLAPPQAPPHALLWEHRLPRVLAELESADADVICLQEVNHFGAQTGRDGALGLRAVRVGAHKGRGFAHGASAPVSGPSLVCAPCAAHLPLPSVTAPLESVPC